MSSNRSMTFTLLLLAVIGSGSGLAQNRQADIYVPPELEPWRDWVLKDKDYLSCPFFFDGWSTDRDAFVCAWPGALALSVDDNGGQFSQSWTVYAGEQWLPLPGDRRFWPEQVTANGSGIELVSRNGAPMVRLAPGRHTIAGRFAWTDRPRTLRIPRQSGLLTLTVNGERVPRPDRNGNGVWLGEPEAEEAAEDSLVTTVYRLVHDDVPTRIVTVITLEVSGSVREEIMGPALPEGFTPLRFESTLPARLEPGGNLRVQVRPGSWEIRLLARGEGVLESVGLPTGRTNLPETEIWSYMGNDRLRVTFAEGLAAVDPLQVDVPDGWEELPAFQIAGGESLSIVERNRGISSTDNQLWLTRRMWLDFDGNGFSVSDTIEGEMRSGWRLDMAAPYEVHSAEENGESLLVTLGDEASSVGVELRSSDLLLEADGRSETRGAMAAAGWQARFAGIDTTLYLPPGHKLLAAIGADQSPGAWVDRWQLRDFFLVLITTIAALRLFGRAAGGVAFFALLLSWHEINAPQWVWLNLLVAVALARVAPAGRLRKTAVMYRGFSVAALAMLLVPFVAGELRTGLFPQLESQRGLHAPGVLERAVMQRQATLYGAGDPQALGDAPRSVMLESAPDAIEEVIVTGAARSYARYAPNAVVRAGPGRPNWRWNTYELGWNGPIDPENTMRLVIMPRWLVSALRFVEVFLVLGFAALFALEAFNKRWRWPARILPANGGVTGAQIAALGLVLSCGLAAPIDDARADTPSAEILLELEQRLLEPPPCVPNCAEVTAANVDVSPDSLSIELQVHALEGVAIALPGSLGGWRPQDVRMDGGPVPHVYRANDDALWIEVANGRHTVNLSGPLPPVDSVSVPFPGVPRIIDVNADGWFVAGVQDRRLVTGSLQLTRFQEEDAPGTEARWENNRFPTFVRVERNVDLGLDWTVTTVLTRVAPEQGALTIRIPLLEGESVLTEDLPVGNGEITISMNPDQDTVQWESNLPRSTPLTLTAPAEAPWKEVWRVAIGHVWRVASAGVPESNPESEGYGARIAEFYPRAGESLNLAVDRPEATTGGTIAFDRVDLSVAVGERSRNSSLSLAYRATRGTQHVIALPSDAELTSVVLDDATSPLRAVEGALSVPILPGEHRIDIEWMQPVEIGARARTPTVGLGAPSSNIDLRMNLPNSRWVLATTGPVLGPAILYWSELAAMILFALILGRLKLTPLTTRQWLLLGLGFSTFSWPVLMFVVFWLLASGLRGRWSGEVSWWRYDLAQVLFALITVAALVTVITAVPQGLLGTPDMHVTGHGSFASSLNWFSDRSDAVLPQASAISLPIWTYKVLILAWALWLSFALLRWLPWVWQCFNARGLWRNRPAKTPEESPAGA